MALDFMGSILGVFFAMMAVILAVFVVTYVYVALTMMFTAKRLKVNEAWLAWNPVGNVYLLSQMAKMDWWPILLILGVGIPFIGWAFSLALFGFVIAWTYKVCEARRRPGWWALLTLIPFFGWIWMFVMWGILAWGE